MHPKIAATRTRTLACGERFAFQRSAGYPRIPFSTMAASDGRTNMVATTVNRRNVALKEAMTKTPPCPNRLGSRGRSWPQ